ncbi:hypothetical protein AALO_G00300950 [Alosa alosa]|uniref:NACHT LRR and PYD domain-containing protein n=1 Tax=Alosa alosa TaxID=278164 RepID=A0AAV6FEU8_9TELE|nr:hypothetical protein AALO_G00300950 [Alosa alosa]
MVAAFMLFHSAEAPNLFTATEIYLNIFRHIMKKGEPGLKLRQLDHFIQRNREKILHLCKLAFSAIKKRSIILQDCEDNNIELKFLNQLTFKDGPTLAKPYCSFLHNTMQEFFAALLLLANPEDIDGVLQDCKSEEGKHMRHVIPFLCGLLSERNVSLVKCLFSEEHIKLVSSGFHEKLFSAFLTTQADEDEAIPEDYEDFLFLCQCLFEMQAPLPCFVFFSKIKYSFELVDGNIDPYQCCALSYVIKQSNDRKIELDLNCNVSEQVLKLVGDCSQHIRVDSCLQTIWTTALNSQNPMLFTGLLNLFGPEFHLPVWEPLVFEKAREVICQRQEKISLILHWDPASQHLSEAVYHLVLSVLPQLNSIRLTPPQFEIISSDEWGVRERSFHLHLCLIAALCEEESEGQSVGQLATVRILFTLFRVTNESDFLLELYSRAKDSQHPLSLIQALQPVYQSGPEVWTIVLSEGKASLFLEVLKFQTQKKPVELRGWSNEEDELRVFLWCLPYISQLRFPEPQDGSISSEEWKQRVKTFHLDLCLQAALYGGKYVLTTVRTLLTLSSVYNESDFLLDLYSHARGYESQTGRSFISALLLVYQSAPGCWSIDLSERKDSLLLEVLKLQTQKKPVVLRGWSKEENEVRNFLQCLPYISQLRFPEPQDGSISSEEWEQRVKSFHLNLCLQAALYGGEYVLTTVRTLLILSSVYNESNFLLDLYSHARGYESQTGRSFISALLPVYQSVPARWSIDLLKRKASLFLEVLKLQTQKKLVDLIGWSDEESEVRSFLQCLPYISQLRFSEYSPDSSRAVKFLVNLGGAAAGCVSDTGESFSELLSSVCSYSTFPFDYEDDYEQSDVLLELYSCVKLYESETSRRLLPVFKPVYQSAPELWVIDLSKRKASLFLEVLKLQTQKKTVHLIDWSDEESEVRSFLQCLPYISELRFSRFSSNSSKAVKFLVNLGGAAAGCLSDTGESFSELLSSVCSYSTFPFGHENSSVQSDVLLELYSCVKLYESETSRRLLPAFKLVYQSVPALWSIDLSKRKASLFLEVLKLQTQKKPVDLIGWSDEE